MSTLRVNTIQNASGGNASTTDNIQQGIAKAWVNFDGTFGTSPFTEANGGIRDAFNVSSVTDNGSGDYTVTFSNAMSNANYCVTLGVKSPDTTDRIYATLGNSNQSDPSTTAFTILCERTSTGTDTDGKYVMASVFGDQ